MRTDELMVDEFLTAATFPRPLRRKELDLLETVLPADRPGYRTYRDLLATMVVLGEGRRGTGNLVLGYEGDRPDATSPLPAVIGYGMVETTRDIFSITVREQVGDQIDIEIVSSHGDEIPETFEEKRRWTYSSWKPGKPSPSNGRPIREIRITEHCVLGISEEEKRLLLFDGSTGIVHLIPVTNFYNELMLHKEIRDPKIALSSSLLFHDSHKYSDDDLRLAFIAYNRLKRRVEIAGSLPGRTPKGLSTVLKSFFRKRT